jgi:hypothetical protein
LVICVIAAPLTSKPMVNTVMPFALAAAQTLLKRMTALAALRVWLLDGVCV